MKNVFKTDEIPHLWANKTQESARNSAQNLFFEGDNIYSYGRHFLIAKHVTNEQGARAILFTKSKYSNTTAKHIYLVRAGSSHLDKIYVPNPANTKTQNFEAWKSEVEAIAKNLLKAKKPEIYLNQISVINEEVKKYTQFLNISIPENLQIALNISNKEEFSTYLATAQERAKNEATAREKHLKQQISKELKEFRTGKKTRLYNRINKDYLRYNEGTKRVETSQGVEIPVQIANKFYKHILKINLKGGCVNCEIKLMEYNVREINSKFIVIGCHNIDIKEINKIAKKLNW